MPNNQNGFKANTNYDNNHVSRSYPTYNSKNK